MITSDDVYAARYAARLTQRDAAALLGVSRRAWESWESGARNMPACKMALFKLLAAPRTPAPTHPDSPPQDAPSTP